MRRLVSNSFVTLDGVMQAPGGPTEDPSGGFAHGGWSVGYWDDAMGTVMDESVAEPFDLLLGRRTYEIFAAHWPRLSGDLMSDRLNGAHKYVASRTLDDAAWGPATIVRDVADEVGRLKAGDGREIQVHGSANLLQALLAHGLLDEMRVWTFPVVVGAGKRLFGSGTTPGGLTLVRSTVSTTGVVMASYRPDGPIRYGSFALDEPAAADAV